MAEAYSKLVIFERAFARWRNCSMRSLVVFFVFAVGGCGDDAQGGAGGSGGYAGASSGGAAGSAGAASGGSAGLGGSGGSAGASGSSGASGSAGAGGLPLPGFGSIKGDCGPIDMSEIISKSPYSFSTNIDFGSMSFDVNALSPGGQMIHAEGGLNPKSLFSEIFSYEILYRCELAKLLKTETKISYTPGATKKTDLLVDIDGYKIGVSVTRAFAFPAGSTFSEAQAQSLLEKKLSDVLVSSQLVLPKDAWEKQILHVLAYNEQHRSALKAAYPKVAPATKADTIVMVTVTDGSDDFIYQ